MVGISPAIAGRGIVALKIVETTVYEATIHVRLADNADKLAAAEWVDLQCKISDLQHAGQSISEPKHLGLSELQRAALRNARDLIDAEIDRLAGRLGHPT
jgi:hypothetical protein